MTLKLKMREYVILIIKQNKFLSACAAHITLPSIASGSLLRNWLILVGGGLFGQLILLAVTPIVTRLYSPSEFGVLSVFVSIVTILSVFSSLRYELSVPLPRKDSEAVLLFCLAAFSAAFFCICLFLAIYFSDSFLVQFSVFSQIDPYLYLIPIGVFGFSGQQLLVNWSVRFHFFKGIAILRLYQSIAQAFFQVGLGLIKISFLGLLISYLAGQFFGVRPLILWTVQNKKLFSSISFRKMFEAGVRYWRFPVFSTMSGLLNSIGLQLPLVFFSVVYGSEAVGFFALAQKIVGVPMAIVGYGAEKIFFGVASKIVRSGRSVLPVLIKSFFILALFSILIFVPLIWEAGEMFPVIFGEGWHRSGELLEVLGFVGLSQLIVVPLVQLLNIMGRQKWFVYWDASRVISISWLFWIAYSDGWQLTETVVWFSLVMSIAYASLLIILIHAALCGLRR